MELKVNGTIRFAFHFIPKFIETISGWKFKTRSERIQCLLRRQAFVHSVKLSNRSSSPLQSPRLFGVHWFFSLSKKYFSSSNLQWPTPERALHRASDGCCAWTAFGKRKLEKKLEIFVFFVISHWISVVFKDWNFWMDVMVFILNDEIFRIFLIFNWIKYCDSC